MVRVLIIAHCGHSRWTNSPSPMNAEQRNVEKDKPCPVCEAIRLVREAESLIRAEGHSYLADSLDDMAHEIRLSVI